MQGFGPERFAQLIETMSVGVFILDASGAALYANATAESLLGRGIAAGDHAENLGERYAAYIAGTDELYPTGRMPIVRALAGESSTVDDLEVDRNGQRIALEITATPLFDASGKLAYAVAVFQDVTERRRAQQMLGVYNSDLEEQVALRTAELERASRAKSVFLMNVSHELRTPLNHIIGFSELLAERLTDDRSRRHALTAETSGRDLLDKINDLIELARIEAQPSDRAMTTFDFDVLLHELGARWSGPPVGTIRSDADTMRRVLNDVLARAVEDKAPISVSRDDETLRITIASERLADRIRAVAHLFGEWTDDKPFQQREVDFRMAVARAQARTMGGDILAAVENQRAVVRVVFPVTATGRPSIS